MNATDPSGYVGRGLGPIRGGFRSARADAILDGDYKRAAQIALGNFSLDTFLDGLNLRNLASFTSDGGGGQSAQNEDDPNKNLKPGDPGYVAPKDPDMEPAQSAGCGGGNSSFHNCGPLDDVPEGSEEFLQGVLDKSKKNRKVAKDIAKGAEVVDAMVTPDGLDFIPGGTIISMIRKGKKGLNALNTIDNAENAVEGGVNVLLAAGRQADKNGLTKAGRALQKHGDRGGSVFPKSAGNAAARNQQGQSILEGILRSENQMSRSNRFGGVDIFDSNTGRGVRFDSDGNMMGFLEP